MGVDGRITSSTSEVLVLTVWDVEVRLRVAVLLGQTKVDDIDLVATLADAHQEVVWLDITVDERLCVDVLDARYELVGQQQDGLERELAVAEVEQVLKGWAKQVQDHGVVVTFCAKPSHKRNAHTTSKRLVDTCLVLQLRVLGLDALELDGDLFTRDDVGACTLHCQSCPSSNTIDSIRRTEVDVAEGAGTDLAADAVLVADPEILWRRVRAFSQQCLQCECKCLRHTMVVIMRIGGASRAQYPLCVGLSEEMQSVCRRQKLSYGVSLVARC